MTVAVKICGLTNYDDALFAMQCGADYLGFVLVPETPRYVAPVQIRKIISKLPKSVKTVGVFMNQPADRVMQSLDETGLNIAQLHGEEEPEEIEQIGRERVWKVVTVSTAQVIEGVVRCPADMLLADSIVKGRRGGTGVVCDWSLAAGLSAQRRIMLAGGLNPDNVAEAVRRVKPFGVDVSSGVEKAPGVKDHGKIRAFIERARAFEE